MHALRIVVLLSVAPSTACGIMAQSVMGWRSSESTTASRQHQVRLEANRDQVKVYRRGEDGVETLLGPTPYVDEVTYTETRTAESPQVLGLLIGGALEVGAAVGALTLGRGSESCFAPNDCYKTSEVSVPLMLTGGLLAYLGVQDLIVAWVHGGADDEIKTAAKNELEQTYIARDGHGAAVPETVSVPMGREAVRFDLPVPPKDDLKLDVAAAPPPPPAPMKTDEWIVAVMAVRDMNAAKPDRALEAGLLVNVESQLRVFLGQRKYRTIDMGTMRAAIASQIDDAKRKSYEQCYDDTCQIELGKALAASHIVRAEVGRFGGVCTLNAELIDLTSEVSIAAASARGDCQDEAFLQMSESVTDQLRAR